MSRKSYPANWMSEIDALDKQIENFDFERKNWQKRIDELEYKLTKNQVKVDELTEQLRKESGMFAMGEKVAKEAAQSHIDVIEYELKKSQEKEKALSGERERWEAQRVAMDRTIENQKKSIEQLQKDNYDLEMDRDNWKRIGESLRDRSCDLAAELESVKTSARLRETLIVTDKALEEEHKRREKEAGTCSYPCCACLAYPKGEPGKMLHAEIKCAKDGRVFEPGAEPHRFRNSFPPAYRMSLGKDQTEKINDPSHETPLWVMDKEIQALRNRIATLLLTIRSIAESADGPVTRHEISSALWKAIATSKE